MQCTRGRRYAFSTKHKYLGMYLLLMNVNLIVKLPYECFVVNFSACDIKLFNEKSTNFLNYYFPNFDIPPKSWQVLKKKLQHHFHSHDRGLWKVESKFVKVAPFPKSEFWSLFLKYLKACQIFGWSLEFGKSSTRKTLITILGQNHHSWTLKLSSSEKPLNLHDTNL